MTDLKNFLMFAFGAKKVSLYDAKLADGVTIMINDETHEVRTVNEDGTLGDPLADGMYVMEDGKMIIVVGGLVSNHEPDEQGPVPAITAAVAAPAAVAVAARDHSEELAVINEQVTKMSERLTALEGALADMKATVTNVEASAVTLGATVNKLATAPAAKSVRDAAEAVVDTRTHGRKLRDVIQGN